MKQGFSSIANLGFLNILWSKNELPIADLQLFIRDRKS